MRPAREGSVRSARGGSAPSTLVMLGAVAMIAALVAAGAGASTSGSRRGAAGPRPAAVPDSALGLSRTSVFSVPAPPRVTPNALDPGPGLVRHRMNPVAPPTVPHGIAGFTPITREENACVGCHAITTRAPGDPIPIPRSHYIDSRNAPGQVQPTIAGARYVCTSCHVARTDVAPPDSIR